MQCVCKREGSLVLKEPQTRAAEGRPGGAPVKDGQPARGGPDTARFERTAGKLPTAVNSGGTANAASS